MPAKLDDLVLKVEAVLFAAGKPLSVHELGEALGVADHRELQRALRRLAETYEGRQTALEVRHLGERYALQLRDAFVPAAQSVTPVDLAPRTLKALTLIAYHQPVLQSLLVRMLGEGAYEEVERLRGLRLIAAEPKGSTLELRTTRSFVEYFGIPSSEPEEIRRFLAERLGVRIPDAARPDATAEPLPSGTSEPGAAPSPSTEAAAEAPRPAA